MDTFGFFAFVAIAVAIYFVVKAQNLKRRREYLMQKYGDATIVEGIMNRQFWQGMTSDMLIDSLGQPEDIDKRVLRSKTSHTYKYNRTGRNRFATRIRLDNGTVVGWDLK